MLSTKIGIDRFSHRFQDMVDMDASSSKPETTLCWGGLGFVMRFWSTTGVMSNPRLRAEKSYAVLMCNL